MNQIRKYSDRMFTDIKAKTTGPSENNHISHKLQDLTFQKIYFIYIETLQV